MEFPDVDVSARLGTTVLGQLDAPALQALCATARVERYQVPTLLNAANEPLRWLRYVVHGHVEIVARRANGDEVALADMGPGSWLTWMGCFARTPPEHDFVSGPNTTCLALPCAGVRQVFQAHPELYPLVIEEIGVRMRQLMEWTSQSVLVGPEQRMARLIHLLARAQGLTADGELQTTQSRLARLARCSRQTANQLLRSLEQRKLIRLAYGRFEIPDMTRLIAFAEQAHHA